jgi:hypothetical protein
MAVARALRARLGLLIFSGMMLVVGGCQMQTVSATKLQIHQALLDHNGLMPVQEDQNLKISYSIPQQWDAMPLKHTLLYTHEQWRSPDHKAGMGAVYIHTPIALSVDTLVWFAKTQYSKDATRREGAGHLIGAWKDSLGRSWFEGENNLYHVKGYAMTHNCDAWIVYSGYRVNASPSQQEIDLAARSAETVVPLTAK